MELKKHNAVLIISVVLLCAPGIFIFCKHRDKTGSSKTEIFFAMDSPCTVTVYENNDLSSIKDRISELDKKLSAHNESSAIYILNKNKTAKLDEDTEKAVKQSIRLTEEYGITDITIGEITSLWNVTGDNPEVPSDSEISKALETVGYKNISFSDSVCKLDNGASLDMGAVGKGFALDEVKKILEKQNTSCTVISFGSSSLMYGTKPDGKPFKIAVKNPENHSDTLLNFEISEGFVSTSGGYERFFEADGKKYCHIFNIKTGRPAETDFTSVTVISSSGIKSDFLSTCIFIDGTQNIGKYLSDSSIKIIAADINHNLYCSDSIKDKIEIKNSSYHLKQQ